MTGQDDEAPDDAVVGARVRQARARLGLTQGQVAERVGRHGVRLHQTGIAKIESGERPLRLTEASAFSLVLGVSLPWLAGLGAETPPPVADPRAEQALRRIVDLAQATLDDPLREAERSVEAFRAMLADLPEGSDRTFVEGALRQAEQDAAALRARQAD